MKTSIGYPARPDGVDRIGMHSRAGQARDAQVTSTHPVHFAAHDANNGPSKLPHDPVHARGIKFTHRFYWFLDQVDASVDRKVVLAAIYRVLRDPRGWERTGVMFVRTRDRSKAHALLSIIPQATTRCGPGAGGCWSWDEHSTQTSEVGVEYLSDPASFATVLGMEMCGHACFRMTDMYVPKYQPYDGAMGTWEAALNRAGFPSQDEIDSSKQWLAGTLDPQYIHDD